MLYLKIVSEWNIVLKSLRTNAKVGDSKVSKHMRIIGLKPRYELNTRGVKRIVDKNDGNLTYKTIRIYLHFEISIRKDLPERGEVSGIVWTICNLLNHLYFIVKCNVSVHT